MPVVSGDTAEVLPKSFKLTRGDLIEEIMSRADDSSGAVAKRHEVGRWLNLAVSTIWRYWPWTFAVTTTSPNLKTVGSDPYVALPLDLQRIKRIRITESGNFVTPHIERVLQENYSNASASEPLHYTDGGLIQPNLSSAPIKAIRLYPTPDQIYTLEITYLRLPPQMTEDEDHLPLPEEFTEAVISWCLVRYFRKLEDLNQAKEHNDSYKDELMSLVGQFSTFHAERYPVLVDGDIL